MAAGHGGPGGDGRAQARLVVPRRYRPALGAARGPAWLHRGYRAHADGLPAAGGNHEGAGSGPGGPGRGALCAGGAWADARPHARGAGGVPGWRGAVLRAWSGGAAWDGLPATGGLAVAARGPLAVAGISCGIAGDRAVPASAASFRLADGGWRDQRQRE